MPPSAIETYPYRTFARAASSRHQKFQNELKICCAAARGGSMSSKPATTHEPQKLFCPRPEQADSIRAHGSGGRRARGVSRRGPLGRGVRLVAGDVARPGGDGGGVARDGEPARGGGGAGGRPRAPAPRGTRADGRRE